MPQKVIVTLIKKIMVRKYATPDAARQERDLFEGEFVAESDLVGNSFDIKTDDYGTLTFPWVNVAGVQWEPYMGLPKDKRYDMVV